MRFVIALIALLEVSPLSAATLKSLDFASDRITATGVKRGGSVLFFGIARLTDGYYSHVVRYETIVADADSDGTVALELKDGVPFKSIWAAIELETGAYLMGTPPDYPQRVTGTDAPVKQVDGKLRRIESVSTNAEVLVVRPDVGAWHLAVVRNSTLDENQSTEGPISVDVRKLKHVGKEAAAPEELEKGDVIVVIDPQWMEFRVAEVKP